MVPEFRGCYIPRRYILNFLGFFGMFNVYAMRVNLSVAMVAMINTTESNVTNQSHRIVECSMLVEPAQKNTTVKFKGLQYNLDSEVEGLILGAFFYGYIITQVPGGFLAEKFGAKWLFGGGVLVTSVLTLLTPLAASSGTAVFVLLRILEGFGEGVTFPAINYMVSQWSPLLERSRVSTIVYIGAQIGNVVSLPVSGWLSSTDLLGGWPSVFYVFGTFGCIWFVFWAVLIYDSPAVHPTISDSELAYFKINGDQLPLKKPKTPWKAIFTSLPMWATLVAHFGHNFGLSIYLIELPNYLSSMLHFNIKEDGALSALPYMVQALVACIASYIADKLRSSGILGITSIRKILNTVGLIGPAICLFCITVSGCRPELIVGLLTLSMALNGFIYSGFNITHVDIAPSFKPKTPWKAIFTSLPMWATLVAHFGHNFGLSIYLIELPNYLSSMLHFNIKEDGALSALPYMVQALVACIASYIADKLRSSGILGITSIRKILNTVGLIGPAICLFCITVSGCRPELIVGLLTLSMALNGFIYSGFNITHVDITPSFAGTLYGITNSFANLNGVIAPAVVGAVTSDGATIRSWNKVFYITSAAYVGGAVFYLFFASAELQPWGKEDEEANRSENLSKISSDL